MAKIPVHVVTGFLGSGKTTFLKEILTNQALNDIALVINELGEVSLDHKTRTNRFYRGANFIFKCRLCLLQ